MKISKSTSFNRIGEHLISLPNITPNITRSEVIEILLSYDHISPEPSHSMSLRSFTRPNDTSIRATYRGRYEYHNLEINNVSVVYPTTRNGSTPYGELLFNNVLIHELGRCMSEFCKFKKTEYVKNEKKKKLLKMKDETTHRRIADNVSKAFILNEDKWTLEITNKDRTFKYEISKHWKQNRELLKDELKLTNVFKRLKPFLTFQGTMDLGVKGKDQLWVKG